MPGQGIVTINGKQWSVSVATTSTELSQGLGGLTTIPAGTGMLFDLGSDQVVSVTTVPMLFNLDIVFINSSLQVVDVAQNVGPGWILTENTPVRYFLEVNAGETQGIAVGDSVNIQGYTPAAVATFDFGSIIGAFLPLLVMFFFFIMARMVMSRMFPPAPPRPAIKAPAVTEEEKLRERKVTLESTGREMASQAGVEFLRLEEGWQAEYAAPKYRFKDPATGHEFVALDLEDLKWKLSIIAGHHSSPAANYYYKIFKPHGWFGKTEVTDKTFSTELDAFAYIMYNLNPGSYMTVRYIDDREQYTKEVRLSKDRTLTEYDILGLPMFTYYRTERGGITEIKPEGGHHSMWLTPEQRKPLEGKYGAVAVRWAEEATRPGDIKAAERAAEYYYKKITEALGLGHLSPKLTEEQIMKLREVLGLDRDVAKVLKIHRETGYVP